MSLYQVMEKENIDSKFNQMAFSDPSFSKPSMHALVVADGWNGFVRYVNVEYANILTMIVSFSPDKIGGLFVYLS